VTGARDPVGEFQIFFQPVDFGVREVFDIFPTIGSAEGGTDGDKE
jgi:hypothetical protein